MPTPGLRTGVALVVVATAVAVAGCGAPPVTPTNPAPPRTSPSPGQGADSAPGSASSDVNASGDAPPQDQDGHPACPAYDSWRPGPNGAGITVTYWYEGTDPVTVLVRHLDGPELSQTADNDVSQRYHDFEFLDVDPKAVTEILIISGDTSCYVRAAPSS